MNRPLHRVLSVEDDADIRTIAVLALATVGGLAVRACASGAEALDAAAKAQASEIEHYRSLGALGVVTRPFDPKDLATRAQDLWRQSSGGHAV